MKKLNFTMILVVITWLPYIAVGQNGDLNTAGAATCSGDSGDPHKKEVTVTDLDFPDHLTGKQANAAWKKKVKEKAKDWVPTTNAAADKAECPEICPDGSPGCKMYEVKTPTPPQGVKSNNRWNFPQKDGYITFRCKKCPEKAEVKAWISYATNTSASCDGAMNMTHLNIPPSYTDDPAVTNPLQAQTLWLDWVVSQNGMLFDASTPWGCPESAQNPGQPCEMSVDPIATNDPPVPVFDGGRWEFPGVPGFQLAYSCGGTSMSINPNPAFDMFQVEFDLDQPVGDVQVHIFDFMMNPIVMENYGPMGPGGYANPINMAGHAPGTYTVQLLLDGNVAETVLLMFGM